VDGRRLAVNLPPERLTRFLFGDGAQPSRCTVLMHYNFAHIHKTLRVSPAMEAGISDHVWSLEEIAALIPEPKSGPRGPYKKR
jgi:hypothetical protein